jgi:hypothetical protein
MNVKPSTCNRLLPIVVILALGSLLSLGGCKDFSFFSELGIKGAITVNPSDVELLVGSSLIFSASGGNSPYTFEVVSGSGGLTSIGPDTGEYSSSSETTAIVMAVDSTGQSGTATVSVVSVLKALAAVPSGATVPIGGGLIFVGTGGVGPYTFDMQTNNSGGSITSGGDYSAGFTTGIDTIRVTDSDPLGPNSVTANVTVTAVETHVDYTINTGDDTFPPDAVAGSSLTGNFTITNTEAATGTASISWWMFISESAPFGGDGEHLIASGVVTDDIPGYGPYVVTPSGSWPTNLPQGAYQLYVLISSPDDLNHGNNEYNAGAITLNVPDVDYQIVSVSHSDPDPRYGQDFSGNFELANAGTADSTEPAQWEVWISENTTIDAGDIKIDSGSETLPYMTAGQMPYKQVSFSGTWPCGTASSTDYHIMVRVSSSQDTAAGNDDTHNTGDSGVVTVYPPQVDYTVSGVTLVGGGEKVPGQPFNGEFRYANNGALAANNGARSLSWTVYASLDEFLDTSDVGVGSGNGLDPLDKSASSGVETFSGIWPLDYGGYYLIVKVESADDEQDSSNDWDVTGGQIQIGVYTESEPNDEWEILPGGTGGFDILYSSDPDTPIVLEPGMSLKIKGLDLNWSNSPPAPAGQPTYNDNDTFMFNTGSANSITFTLLWSTGTDCLEIWIYEEGDPAPLVKGVKNLINELSLTIIQGPGTDQFDPNQDLWFNAYYNKMSGSTGPYTAIITAN